MSQDPTEGQPGGPPPPAAGGFPPPPGYSVPPPPPSAPGAYGAPSPGPGSPGYGAPGGFIPPPSTPPPPPRKGTAWWVWVLAGCGGCAVLALILGVVATLWFGNAVKDALKNTGPITAQQAQQQLGPEVPLYPGAVFDENSTRGGLIGLKLVEKAGAKDLFRGIGAYRTEDPAEKIWAFYDKELGGNGWTKPGSGTAPNQRIYQKGKDVILVQIQDTAGRVIILMRGGPGLMKMEGK